MCGSVIVPSVSVCAGVGVYQTHCQDQEGERGALGSVWLAVRPQQIVASGDDRAEII